MHSMCVRRRGVVWRENLHSCYMYYDCVLVLINDLEPLCVCSNNRSLVCGRNNQSASNLPTRLVHLDHRYIIIIMCIGGVGQGRSRLVQWVWLAVCIALVLYALAMRDESEIMKN